MRGKPVIILFTLVISGLVLLFSISGAVHIAGRLEMVSTGEISVLGYAGRWLRLIVEIVLSALTLYAIFKRPSWGRVVTVCFAVMFCVVGFEALLTPDPTPLFPLNGAAEKAGAQIANVAMGIGFLAYLGFVMFGRKTRDYFARPAAASENHSIRQN
ncbi:hypothetical protein EC912_105280 [Luteibacter rhizovicinus]|uniref:Membrane protein YkgB n=1 Tax=Luteibacter rhizovicinus TaxID=242606 RepID=A0A4V2W3U5_9GAMM|nr:hypothetical protein [Luteibacter rhizovicinus]TCV93419.1 hypothetical protein EC912_105280 [Luteibacter rhizovicinus]